MRTSLNDQWIFRQVGTKKWLSAKVPGCNYLDLLANNIIKDPFWGVNEYKAQWVSEKDWEYKRIFNLTKKDLDYDSLFITFDNLDTIAEIYLNNKLLASTNNAHIKHSFDIKDLAIDGENELFIRFISPNNYVREKQKLVKCPKNLMGLTGIPHIRKPQYHFGWDWGPALAPSGISGNVYLEKHNGAKINDILILQKHQFRKVTLKIKVDSEVYSESTLTCKVNIFTPDGKKITAEANLESENNFELEIEDPKLWWTAELSKKKKQDLYKVVIEISNGESQVLDEVEKKIGLRTIQLAQNTDDIGKNFQFILNGHAIFAKGANWIPSDSFVTRTGRDKLKYYIDNAVDCNFNMLRVWGGGYYEGEDFYDLCDEAGILVWQDFAYACQPYPFFLDDFLENAKREAKMQIKRLRHRASLALFCGNNEIELLSIAWRHKINFTKWTEIFFRDILKNIAKDYAPQTSYIPGSPIGHKFNKGINSDNVGNTHLWAVWHGLKPMTYYRKRLTRFCSEFGFESLPNIKTIKSFALPEDYSLTSEVFLSHQKCLSGNIRMAYYIASRFRLPQEFTDYIYLSGICQLECVKDATEHWRRNKGHCNGSLYWQYNDCWPVVSWASVDYYGNFKALQYGAKHFFAPRMLSIEDQKEFLDVYVINDLLEENICEFDCHLYDFHGKKLWERQHIQGVNANSAVMATRIYFNEWAGIDLKNCVFVASLHEDGKVVSRKTLLFDKEKNLNLPKAKVSLDVEIENNMAIYTLSSDKFARLCCLDSGTNTNPFSDNYIDLIPNYEYKITQKLEKEYTKEELISSVKVRSLSDIEFSGSKLKDLLFRLKVFLTPYNFLSWLHYSISNKKTKLRKEK